MSASHDKCIASGTQMWSASHVSRAAANLNPGV